MRRYAFEEGRTPLIDFRRDTERGLLLGVCAGLAERFEITVTVIRLAFLISFLVGFGTSLLLYVVLWVVMPREEDVRYRIDGGPSYDPYDPEA